MRKEGYTRARSATAGFILDAICSVILSGGKPVSARLVAAAIRDTGQVNASVMIHSVRSWRRQKTEAAVGCQYPRRPSKTQALEDIASPDDRFTGKIESRFLPLGDAAAKPTSSAL